MNKQEIISEIQRIASENEGKAPGAQSFSEKTGIKRSEWYPNLWLRWGDAITDAGYAQNEFCSASDTDYLITKYIELINELGHFPIEGELRNKRKNDNQFPSHGAFRQLGFKQERVKKILQYCHGKKELDAISSICANVTSHPAESVIAEEGSFNEKNGYVYLIKHGNRNEYKIGKTFNPIRREGEIRLQLPDKIEPIHYIETDDPSGIETYWHTRFSKKRKEGEWFNLNAGDVRAFKKWKKIS